MYPSEVTHPSPSTTLQVEKQLSLLYRTFRIIMRPFRSRFAKPSKRLPGGSPKLSYPKHKATCTITEQRDESSGMWFYDFKPNGVEIPPKNIVLYFAGSGFQGPPQGEHWGMVGEFAKRLPHKYAFSIVSSPCAPESPASESLPILRKYLRGVMERAAKDGRTVTLMGDSSGGNIALSLGFWWAEQVDKLGSSQGTVESRMVDSSTDEGSVRNSTPEPLSSTVAASQPGADLNQKLKSVLKSVFVISPAVDHRNTNPQIKEIDRHDPLLGYNTIESVSQIWTAAPPGKPEGASSRTDPKISPLLHPPSSYRLLKEQGIKVHGLMGTYDALAPDAELFRLKCVEHDIGGDWLVWEGQMHCFVLAARYRMNEGMHGVDWLSQTLDKNA